MVWAKLDDEILDNEKIVRAGILGFALHAAAVTWCCRNLTDGFIPHRRAMTLFDMGALEGEYVEALGTHPSGCIDKLTRAMHDVGEPTARPVIARLVEAKLWAYDEDRDGYWLKDFLLYNPSREKVLAERARGAERKQKSRGDSPVGSTPPRATSRAESRRDIRQTPGRHTPESGAASDGPVPVPEREIPPTPHGGVAAVDVTSVAPANDRTAEAHRGGMFGFELEPYREGIQAGVRRASKDPAARVADFPSRAAQDTARLLSLATPGLDDDARLAWVRSQAEAFVVAQWPKREYQNGWHPRKCVEWVNAGRPVADGGVGPGAASEVSRSPAHRVWQPPKAVGS